MLRVFGKMPSGKEKEKVIASQNYRAGWFQNLQPTATVQMNWETMKKMVHFFNKPSYCTPPKVLPSVRTNLNQLDSGKTQIIWFGHSSYFIKMNGKNILVDPVFSGHASPIRSMIPAFAGTNQYGVNDMPDIDILLITHDHYDHLDYETIIKLKPKVKAVCTSLGVASHLVYWGYDKEIIHELDWHQSTSVNDLYFEALPARHFSGRGTTRDQTLWSSFILQSPECKLYLGGDSGYSTSFKEIGEKHGFFDIAILECGQYNTSWPDIHMMPEETAQAALDLKANVLMPVHWGKFALALHPWNEPIQRIMIKAKELGANITTPMIGEPVIVDEIYPDKHWWEL